MSETLSKMITFLRFPLIVLVICIHAPEYSGLGTSAFDSFSINLLANTISRASVPLFFIISSFLFFPDGEFTKEKYLHKNKKRIRSLLVPYLIWNLLVIISLIITGNFPYLPASTGWFDNVKYYLSAFVCFKQSGIPIAFQFWFIRDLMILNILSPIIYRLVKDNFLGTIWVSALLILWIMFEKERPFLFNISAITFYSIGAYLRVHHIGLDIIANKVGHWGLIYPAFLLADCFSVETEWHRLIHSLQILPGVLVLLRLAYLYVTNRPLHISGELASASFFVFAIHAPWCLSISKKILNIAGCPQGVLLYISIVCISSLLGSSLYFIVKRFAPRTVSLLSGNR